MYGYTITPKGREKKVLESVWGFYGGEYAKTEMKDALDAYVESEKEEKKKIDRMMAL